MTKSAHCVAHTIVRRVQAELRAVAPQESERAVLEAILAESLAFTVESLASVPEYMPVSDLVFYSVNSGVSRSQKRADVQKTAGAELGAESRFALPFFSYFEATLALQPPTDSTYRRIAEAGGRVADPDGLARDIADTCFQNELRFPGDYDSCLFWAVGLLTPVPPTGKRGLAGQGHNQSFARMLTGLFRNAAGKV